MKKAIYTLILITLFSCVKERSPSERIIIGSTDVDLNANDSLVRAKECLIGNLIADANVDFAKQRGHNVDFSILNGGAIRFNDDNRSDGIYRKGPISNDDVEEMIPFFEYGSTVSITGLELVSIFERSVANIEQEHGGFLQVSAGIEIIFDLSKQPQLIDNTVFPTEIAQEGSRLISLKINGDTLDLNKTYTIFTNNFIAFGGDDYVTLRKIPDSKKTEIEEIMVNALTDYFLAYSPVNPQLENRISILP